MCVVVGGSDSVWLTPLSSLPWHQLKRLAPPRLLLAFWGLFSGLLAHQWLLKPAKGRRSVGGLVEFLLKNTTLAVGGGLVVLWTLDGLIAASLGSTAISSILQPRLLATLRVNLARLLMLSCFCLLGVLVHRPLLIAPTPVPRDAAPPRVCNHAIGDAIRVFEPDDVYAVWLFAVLVAVPALTLLALLGDVYVLPCLGLLACLLLAPVHELALPRGRRTENDACSQVASQLEGVGSWPSAIYACLLGQFGFFCFGHQTTFPAIPWSAAFAVFQGDHGTTLLPAGLVLAHTFTAQILLTAALPLLLIVCVLRRTSPTTKSTEPVLFRSQQGPMVLRTTLDRLLRRYCIAHFLLVRSVRGAILKTLLKALSRCLG
uniref:Acyl_transf_3 domain-containing protein n=1 Tax=Mesocestoides corti TaxID=53468 RepID=A0A5K3FZ22_MESCO